MRTLRTPDHRFTGLPDWPYEPHHVELGDSPATRVRMHVVDEGDPTARPVLLLHGEPTWGYLYRRMIPDLVAAGLRPVVPDLIGFGRSDKPVDRVEHSYGRHVDWVCELVDRLELSDAIFFGQDWGSLIGLAAVMRRPDRFGAVVLANGGLPDPRHPDRTVAALMASPDPEAFFRWQAFAASADELSIGELLSSGLEISPGLGIDLTAEERAAYDAPFPDAAHQAGPLVFPALVGAQGPDDDPEAIMTSTWDQLERWDEPFLCLYGDRDPILGHWDRLFIEHVPGAAGQPHRRFPDAGHFIQETEPDALVDGILAVHAQTVSAP